MPSPTKVFVKGLRKEEYPCIGLASKSYAYIYHFLKIQLTWQI